MTIYDEVRTLPETQAQEVLDFVARLKAKRQADSTERWRAALQILRKYRGRFTAEKLQREDPYNCKGVR